METSRVQYLVNQLEDNIDDLEETLKPIIIQALSESTKKLPLLDKAKLHIVIVYAIESLLFSYLKLNNVDAKEHPVFRELTRVKQYFEKVKSAEEGPIQPRENLSLNKQAAARIIKHALAGNDKLDLARLEQEAREKLLARRKLKDLETSMKEKAQADQSTPQSIEEQLVNQIAAEIEQSEGLPSPTTPAEEAVEHEVTSTENSKKRKQHNSIGKGDGKIKAGDAKASKKARKKSKKDAKTVAQAPG